MNKWLIILLSLVTSSVFGKDDFRRLVPLTGKSFKDFIPKGYDTLGWRTSIAVGDLNKDGVDDIVLVLKDIEAEQKLDGGGLRPLVVLFKEKDYYRLAAIAMYVVMCKDCGGAMGDPFVGVSIEKNTLTVYHYGGTAWRWSVDTKFRYQNDDFYLIGKTKNSFWIMADCDENANADDAAKDYEDVNYITGDRIRKKTSEQCKVLLDKKDKIKTKPLIKMANSKVIDN